MWHHVARCALSIVLLLPTVAVLAAKAPPPADWELSASGAVQRAAELAAYLDQFAKGSKEQAQAQAELPQQLAAKRAEPAWVKKGSWIDQVDGREVRFGVGTVSGIGNAQLAQNVAGNRARAELGKLKAVTVEEKKNPDGSKAVTTKSATTLAGVVIVDWYLGANGTWYALAMQPGS